MTIDEPLERLTERHEKLTQTVELMAAENRERDRRMAEVMEGIGLFAPRQSSTFMSQNWYPLRRAGELTQVCLPKVTQAVGS